MPDRRKLPQYPSILPWDRDKTAPFPPQTQALWVWWCGCYLEGEKPDA